MKLIAAERHAFNKSLRNMSLDKHFDSLCEIDKALLTEKVKNTTFYRMYVMNELMSDLGNTLKKAVSDAVNSFTRGFQKGKHDK